MRSLHPQQVHSQPIEKRHFGLDPVVRVRGLSAGGVHWERVRYRLEGLRVGVGE